ncbi:MULTISPECIES: hypothetical protein [unclassified Brevundimonas]|uniref:hypothetical protein n=1 Tax=unclassified Brevundimonas TaxID=2622653 RepID=UPI0025C65E05|nr:MULTISPECIES: hypothetical protein [unclassified Brevundimonas]
MAQLTLPTLPRSATFSEEPVTAGSTQKPAWGGPLLPLERTGDRWAFEVAIPALEAATCGAAFKLILAKGKLNTVIMAIPETGMPARNYGAPRTRTSGAQGTTLPVKGLTPGVVIPNGKWINLVVAGRNYLYLVDGQVTANSSGEADIKVWPMIRRSAAADATVRIADPVIEGHVPVYGGAAVDQIGAVALNFRIEEAE